MLLVLKFHMGKAQSLYESLLAITISLIIVYINNRNIREAFTIAAVSSVMSLMKI